MATREHQGLQIALIIFVMLTVILGITTYYFQSEWKEVEATIAGLKADETRMENKAMEAKEELDSMKHLLGFQQGDEIKAIEEAWTADMAPYKPVIQLEEGDLSYRNLITYLAAEVRKQDKEVSRHSSTIAKIDSEKVMMLASHKAATAKQHESVVLATTDLATQRDTFVTDRGKFVAAQAATTRKFDVAADANRKIKRSSKKKLDDINREREKFRQLADARADKLNSLTREKFETADAKITWVNQRSNLVYINVGRADNLRPQISFSVYGRDVNKIASEKPKGSIEVTRLLDRHLAEARIINDQVSDPIVPGDVVFTPTWTAGVQRRFAFAGLIDMDGNGKSDMRRIKDLIRRNGAKIDALVDELGERSGKITVDTRFLVVGKPPKSTTKDTAGVENFSRLVGEARTLGVEQISVEKFLEMMGWKASRRVVTLGRGARSDDFKAKPTDGVIRKSNGNVFKPRRP